VFKQSNRFKSLSATVWGKDVPRALDVGDLANRTFAKSAPQAAAVVLGPDGSVLWQGSKLTLGGSYYPTAGRPPVPYADLLKGIKPHLGKGLLGDIKIPAQLEAHANLIKFGKLGAAESALSKVRASGNVADVAKTLCERIEGIRKEKRELFDSLMSAGKLWDAYKVGSSYVRCFSRAKDVSKVRSAVSSMKYKGGVKDNLSAQQSFARLAQIGYGSRAQKAALGQVAAAMKQLAEKKGDTEFGAYASEMK
jgi:hypothetical protein